jgi:hypothetical protein
MVFLNTYMKIPSYNLKLEDGFFLPNPSQFITRQSSNNSKPYNLRTDRFLKQIMNKI